jgi:hypothetical protein
MTDPRAADSPARLADDQLGSLAVALVVGELRWTPDVAPAVMDRISRDAVAYPDQFDRRPRAPAAGLVPVAETPSLGRTLGRVVVFASIAMLVVVLVLVAATANAAGSSGSSGSDIGALAEILLSLTEAS